MNSTKNSSYPLTVGAALLLGAVLVVASNVVSVRYGDETVGAPEARAERLTALLRRAVLVVASDLVGIWHRRKSVRAREARAESLAALPLGAHVAVASLMSRFEMGVV